MNKRTKTGLAIIQVALILGVLGDVLLRAKPWGLNVLLFNLAFAGGTVTRLRQHRPWLTPKKTNPAGAGFVVGLAADDQVDISVRMFFSQLSA